MSTLFSVIEASDTQFSGSGTPVLKVAHIDGEVFLSIGALVEGSQDFPDAESGIDSQGVSGEAGISVSVNDLLDSLYATGAISALYHE